MEQFDFKKVGKRMPYSVPEDFFTKMEENVWKDVSEDLKAGKQKPQRILRIVTRATMAVAASAAVLFFIFNGKPKEGVSASSNDMLAIEQAFSQLTDEDQGNLLDIYQDDVFLNENIAQ